MLKKHHWFDIAEYASLVGLGVGAIASHLSTQLIYTSAPLSVVLALNLLNRRRFDQLAEEAGTTALQELDQTLSKQVELLNQQVLALPTVETVSAVRRSLLVKHREGLEKLAQEFSSTQAELRERLALFEEQDLGAMQQDVAQLHGQYHQLNDAVVWVTAQLQGLSSANRVDDLDQAIAQLKSDTTHLRTQVQGLSDQTRPALSGLHDQVGHLTRQFQKLPPPFDPAALKQEVAELIRVVADLVPRRDLSTLEAKLYALHQQQESHAQNEATLRSRIQDLYQQLQANSLEPTLTGLQDQLDSLHRQVQTLPPPFDPSSLQQELAELIQAVADRVPVQQWTALNTQVEELRKRQEFQAQLEDILQRELQTLNQQLQTFVAGSTGSAAADADEEIDQLQPQQKFQAQIAETLRLELKTIDRQLQALPSGPQLQARIAATVGQELLEINEQLRTFPSDPHYELVFDFNSTPKLPMPSTAVGSRAVLEEALEKTQERLILILPWSDQCPIDEALIQKMSMVLRQKRQLHLGWCHPTERSDRFLRSINQRWSIQPRQQELQRTLKLLLKLKQAYPNHFEFRILGTSENFLICDRTFAVLGTDRSLTRHTVFPELQLKLRTTDTGIIQQLIHRFDNPDPHPNDATAHWNRGVTRYELGDKQGAVVDFSHVLALTPDDAVVYNYRGLAQFELGDQTRAIADFNRALSINPQSAVVYCNRGFVLAEMGEQVAAIADYTLAIQNQPTCAIAHFYRGQSCQAYGDPQGALADYTEAIRLAPTAALCYYYRGLVRQKLGDWYGAIADLEVAVQQFNQAGNPTNAQKALKLLTQLRSATHPPVTSAASPRHLKPAIDSDSSRLRNGDSHSRHNGASNGTSTLTMSNTITQNTPFISLVNTTSDPLPSLFNSSFMNELEGQPIEAGQEYDWRVGD